MQVMMIDYHWRPSSPGRAPQRVAETSTTITRLGSAAVPCSVSRYCAASTSKQLTMYMLDNPHYVIAEPSCLAVGYGVCGSVLQPDRQAAARIVLLAERNLQTRDRQASHCFIRQANVTLKTHVTDCKASNGRNN